MADEDQLEKAEEGAAPWMLTYGDMVTLLLTFFVLLFSFATIDVQKFREVVISLKGTLGVLTGGEQVIYPGDLPKPNPESGLPVPAQDLAQPVPTESDQPGPEGQKADIDTYQSGLGQVIAMPNIAFFDKGSAKLKLDDEGKHRYLDRIVVLMDYYTDNQVSIIGHADPDPIESTVFESNWHLASARAIAVIEYYTQKGIPANRFSLTAYAEHRPVVNRSGDPMLDDKQRRIDIILHPKRTPSRFEMLQLSPE